MTETIVKTIEVRKVFSIRRGHDRVGKLIAVDGISMEVARNDSLAIVGESGSGKTTLARMLVGLEKPTSGRIVIDGEERVNSSAHRRQRLNWARKIQIVFQDPYSSLDPRQSAASCISEVLRVHFELTEIERNARIAELGEQVGLGHRELHALPRDLSGGQRQRLAIARALAVKPQVLVLDEAVSALDVSVQAQILNLLVDIREQTDVTYIFVSHDLAVIRQVTENVVVMYRGRIVETGPTDRVLDSPADPYTRLLRDSVPGPGWTPKRRQQNWPAGDLH
jgi:peptide/nickel transport system ATP-binding protein